MTTHIPHPERHYVKNVKLQPNSEIRRHTHPVDVTMTVLDGWVRLWVDGYWSWLGRSDVTIIPKQRPHAVMTDDQPALIELTNISFLPKPRGGKRAKNVAGPYDQVAECFSTVKLYQHP